MADIDQSSTTSTLMFALRRVLRPLVRLMVAKSVTYPMLTDMLKEIFVEAATQDFQLPERELTDSRISLLTGVHRKDVRRLRGTTGARGRKVPGISLGAQVVALWAGTPEFVDAAGQPLPLQRTALGGGRSFEELAARVSTDIRSRPMLDELLRLGLVRIDEEDRVVLVVDAFVPEEGLDEKLFYFHHNLHDHAAAAVDNVVGAVQPWLERSVHYDDLNADALPQLRALAEKAGMQAIYAVNRKALSLSQAEGAEPVQRQRMTFGVYFFAAPAAENPARTGVDEGVEER
jgi:hypothetical protein